MTLRFSKPVLVALVILAGLVIISGCGRRGALESPPAFTQNFDGSRLIG